MNAVSRAQQSNAPLVKATAPISVHGRGFLNRGGGGAEKKN